MGQGFDPYHKWLGIPPREQPPHHYRLLGLEVFESDEDVIEASANRQIAFVESHLEGPQSQEARRLIKQIRQARHALLDATERTEYDAALRRRLEAEQPPDDAPEEFEEEGSLETPPEMPAPPAATAVFEGPPPAAGPIASHRREADAQPARSPTLLYGLILGGATLLSAAITLVILMAQDDGVAEGPEPATPNVEPAPTAPVDPQEEARRRRIESQLSHGSVVDNGDLIPPPFWEMKSGGDVDYVGDGYLLLPKDKAPDASPVRYRPPEDLPKGRYDVYVSYPPGETNATNVVVRAVRVDGNELGKAALNQRQAPERGGLFQKAFAMSFDPELITLVEIGAAEADGDVVADAIQFVPSPR